MFGLLYCLTGAWTVWPVVSVGVADGVAALLHCRLSEGGPLPCHFLGIDISRHMYIAAVSFWYALVTLPTGVPTLIAIGIAHLAVWACEKIDAGRERRDRSAG